MLLGLLLFFIIALPFQPALNPVPGVDLASSRIFIIVLFIFWLTDSLKNRKLRLPGGWESAFILSFLFLSAFSLFQAENPEWGWRKLLFLLSFFPLFPVAVDLLSSPGRFRKAVSFLVVSGTLAALAGIVQFFSQFLIGLDQSLNLWRRIAPFFLGNAFAHSVNDYSSWLVNIGGRDFFRAIAFFPDPHMFSLFLGLTLPWALFLTLLLFRERSRFFLPGLFASFAILAADLLTFSRGGYLGLVGGGLAAALWWTRKHQASNVLAFLIISLILITFLVVPNPVGERFSSSFDPEEGSNQERIANWDQAFGVIAQKPLLGTGIGNYSLTIKPTADYREPIYAHNLFLDVAAETGVPSAFFLIALLAYSIRSFLSQAFENRLMLGGAVSLVVFSIHSLFESGLYSVQVLPILLIIIALSTLRQKYEI